MLRNICWLCGFFFATQILTASELPDGAFAQLGGLGAPALPALKIAEEKAKARK